jgi:hypothetical protein
MSNRENFLQADEVDSKEEKIEMMIKKHEDFDKAIGNQEVSVKLPFFYIANAVPYLGDRGCIFLSESKVTFHPWL